MYKHIAILSAAGLCLAGCANSGSTISTSAVNADLATVEAEAQKIAQTTCAFIPTAATVASIVIPLVTKGAGAGSPIAIEQLASTAATAICGAVTTKSARRGVAYVPRVGRVRVHGQFLDGSRI